MVSPHARATVSDYGAQCELGAAGAGAAAHAQPLGTLSRLRRRAALSPARGPLALSPARVWLHVRRAHRHLGRTQSRVRRHVALAREALRARGDREPGRGADGRELSDGPQSVHAAAPRHSPPKRSRSCFAARSRPTRATSGPGNPSVAAAFARGAGRRTRRPSSASSSATAMCKSPWCRTEAPRRSAITRCAG